MNLKFFAQKPTEQYQFHVLRCMMGSSLLRIFEGEMKEEMQLVLEEDVRQVKYARQSEPPRRILLARPGQEDKVKDINDRVKWWPMSDYLD